MSLLFVKLLYGVAEGGEAAVLSLEVAFVHSSERPDLVLSLMCIGLGLRQVCQHYQEPEVAQNQHRQKDYDSFALQHLQ
jgi:hypothetical protein